MGCAPSSEEKGFLRVLVLGIQSSGKSTFAKQMKILHCNGFREDEINNYKDILTQNLMLGYKELLDSAEGISRDLKKSISFFANSNPYSTEIDNKLVKHAEGIWGDKAIKSITKKPGTRAFEYLEILKYIMDSGLNRLLEPDFSPSNEDILHIRQRTTGISETKFKADRHEWNIIDVGGQRVERRKWTHTNQNLNAIIYFASLVDYDIISEDDEDKTRLEESLDVWEDVLKGDTVPNLPLILFFNKVDIFPQKLKRSPLKNTFKKYKGGDDVRKGQTFIMDMYLDRMEKSETQVSQDSVKTHFICALDTENMKIVFHDIMDYIIRKRLELSGL